jgi:hypothetical protein
MSFNNYLSFPRKRESRLKLNHNVIPLGKACPLEKEGESIGYQYWIPSQAENDRIMDSFVRLLNDKLE